MTSGRYAATLASPRRLRSVEPRSGARSAPDLSAQSLWLTEQEIEMNRGGGVGIIGVIIIVVVVLFLVGVIKL